MSANYICYTCGERDISVFCEMKNVPVHSVLLMSSREIAVNYPKGDIALGFCQNCGFISNVAFDPRMHEYSSRYEETQGFSPTFNTFHRNLANQLIRRHNLHNKDIIEIGCGKGEFLTMLCELGENRGVGFDPSYISERNQSEVRDRITFIRDFYSEKYANYHGDFICCKMTLEHIHLTADFVRTVRRSLENQQDTVVFFQVPDVIPILRGLGFWDIYYEHCSYFSRGSLARLFRMCGFDIINLTRDYNDQYLMIEARPGNGTNGTLFGDEDDFEELSKDVLYFSQNYRKQLDRWRYKFKEIKQSGKRAVIWGSGSKGVTFLTSLNITDEIEFVVDINPYKHGMYMPGTGHKIVGPVFLQEYKPDIAIVMNPIYCEEIQHDLQRRGLATELITVESE